MSLVSHCMSQTCLEELVLQLLRESAGTLQRQYLTRASWLSTLWVSIYVSPATPVLDSRAMIGIVPVVNPSVAVCSCMEYHSLGGWIRQYILSSRRSAFMSCE